MEINVPKYIFKRFNRFSNIEYEIEWMLGYIDKKIFNEEYYRNISYNGEYVIYNVPEEVIIKLESSIKNINREDIDKVIYILYLALYVLGGTN